MSVFIGERPAAAVSEATRSVAAVLAAERVRVRFGSVWGLHLDELRIPAADGVGGLLMGPNGAGKTTLLDALTGFTQTEPGVSVRLSPRTSVEIGAASRFERVRAGLVRTFQRPPVLASLTVGESLQIAGAVAQPLSAELVDAVARALGLQDILTCSSRSLPLHTLRRVELARAICTQPRLLLLDEPSAGIDEREREHLIVFLTRTLPHIIRTLSRAGAYRFAQLTTCLVTHDVKFALRLSRMSAPAPIVHVLVQGRIAASGPLVELLAMDELRSAYFGAAPAC